MKWLTAAGATQHSSDGRYCVVEANAQHWIAYEMHSTTATELGVRDSASKARVCCEAEEARLLAGLKGSA